MAETPTGGGEYFKIELSGIEESKKAADSASLSVKDLRVALGEMLQAVSTATVGIEAFHKSMSSVGSSAATSSKFITDEYLKSVLAMKDPHEQMIAMTQRFGKSVEDMSQNELRQEIITLKQLEESLGSVAKSAYPQLIERQKELSKAILESGIADKSIADRLGGGDV